MKHTKFLIPIALLSLVAITGCDLSTASNANTGNSNKAGVVNTANTAQTNTNAVVVTNTTNANTANTSDIDTSDWQVYSNHEIGLQFEYPLANKIQSHLTDCTTGQCGYTTGKSYYLNTLDQNGGLQFAFAGAATPNFQAERDLGFFDVSFFTNNGNEFKAVLSENDGFVITPLKQTLYANGEVVIYAIKELPSYPQLLDVMPERKEDKVAIYNFTEPVNGFKSISIILTPEMNEQDIDRILNSVIIL